MKEDANNVLIICLITVLSIITSIVIIPNYFQTDSGIVQLVMWLLILCISFFIRVKYKHFRTKIEKVKTVLIVLFLYYISYLLLGLLMGYQKSPYPFSINEIAKRFFLLLGVVLIQEYVRTKIVNNTNTKWVAIITTILFFIIHLDFSNIDAHFGNAEAIFQYSIQSVLVSALQSVLLTYLSTVGGLFLNYAYSIPITLASFLIPVYPNLDWFMESSLQILLIATIFFLVYYEKSLDTRVKEKVTHHKPMYNFFILAILLVFIGFVSGFFSIRPIAVLSNSMQPTFKRGDIVISQKVKPGEDVEMGEVLEYYVNGKIIMHRLIGKEKDIFGNTLYITKGDNNSNPDKEKVLRSQILGKIKYSIPYFGYPSVLLKELLVQFER